MKEPEPAHGEQKVVPGFRDREWQPAYRTSARHSDGRPTDILRDFYIPVLERAVGYDRVAGYFRSSSLAIASQGFSAFTSKQGRMRLVVGADLEVEDVAAILEGDQSRLEERLGARLEGEASWPEAENRGVRLLAWMVAKGFLEVQVAFRVHSATGKPLAFDDVSDGYVHEKWAVFRDSEGNRLSITGSLNESKTALTLNAENIDVHAEWWNDLERERTDRMEADFTEIWANRCPYLRVMPLPEAVRKQLLHLAANLPRPVEVDGTSAMPEGVPVPSALERLRFALIKDGPRLPGGRFVGMETAPVVPWPHQEVVARRLIESWPYSYLLCDEVGLGKTIEAGLAIRSLVLAGLAKRVLIASPASLAAQWQREMASKFLLSFGRAQTGSPLRHEYIFPEPDVVPGKSLYTPDLAIVSTGLMARQDRRRELASAARFDIALVDEAHYARRQNPTSADSRRAEPRFGRLYSTIRDELRPRTAALWLATATPMQMDWIEVYDLIRLSNRVGAFQNDPTLTWGYYDILGRLVHDQDVRTDEWQFLRRVTNRLVVEDPLLWKHLETAVIDGRIRTCSRRWLEQGRIARGRDLANLRRLIFSVSPLSRVMLRHTRPLLAIYRDEGQLQARLARRTILPMPRIVFTPLEQQAYEGLESYCSGLSEQMQQHGGEASSAASNLQFFLSMLRLRFASSLFAIRETLRRRRDRVVATLQHIRQPGREEALDALEVEGDEDEDGERQVIDALLKNRTEKDLQWERRHLGEMLATLGDLQTMPSKMQAFLGIMNQRRLGGGRYEQTVVFTRFYDTLTDMVKRLRAVDPAMLIGTYSGHGGTYVDPATGGLQTVERDEIKHRFLREEIDVLICTDAAAEGLNLQTANLLINFDLPWNPMKVEQRIGRIDRIGQKYEEISVVNLCYVGSVEETVYGRLLQRLQNAAGVVGSQQVSMLPITEEDFRLLASGELSEHELEQQARERIALQQQRTASMEIPARDLYDIYVRMAQQQKREPLPVSLEQIWQVLCESGYLQEVGCSVSTDGRVMTVRGVEQVDDGALLTADRMVYDKGLPGESRPIHFASYGDPVFEAILAAVDRFGLPSSVRRLTAPMEGTDTDLVGYAVLTGGENGVAAERLVVSLGEAESLQLGEQDDAGEQEVPEALQDALRRMAREAGTFMRVVESVERMNVQAALTQERLAMSIAFRLLSQNNVEGGDPFYQVVHGYEEMLTNGETVAVYNLLTRVVHEAGDNLVFEITAPQVGTRFNLIAPPLLIHSAVDTACRHAESMRRRRAEITAQDVKDRLNREIQRLKGWMQVLG